MIPSFDQVMEFTKDVSDQAMHPEEVRKFHELLCAVPEHGLVVEVGCQLGRSSSVIAQIGKESKFRSLHIDPYVEQPDFLTGWVRMMFKLQYQFTLLCMPTEKAAWHLAHYGNIDLAFIDGDHEKPGVEIDLRLVANKIRPGGVLVAHDYATNAHPGVALAVDAFVASGWEHIGTTFTMGYWRRK